MTAEAPEEKDEKVVDLMAALKKSMAAKEPAKTAEKKTPAKKTPAKRAPAKKRA